MEAGTGMVSWICCNTCSSACWLMKWITRFCIRERGTWSWKTCRASKTQHIIMNHSSPGSTLPQKSCATRSRRPWTDEYLHRNVMELHSRGRSLSLTPCAEQRRVSACSVATCHRMGYHMLLDDKLVPRPYMQTQESKTLLPRSVAHIMPVTY